MASSVPAEADIAATDALSTSERAFVTKSRTSFSSWVSSVFGDAEPTLCFLGSGDGMDSERLLAVRLSDDGLWDTMLNINICSIKRRGWTYCDPGVFTSKFDDEEGSPTFSRTATKKPPVS